MKRNMKQWIEEYRDAPVKKAAPILSFPGVQLLGHTVEELVKSGELQAECIKAVADRFPAGIAFSLMDLSVEAEAFGSRIQYRSDEVPTVCGTLIRNEEEAETLEIPEVGAGRTGECIEGIRLAGERIADRPVLAGMIGPFSLAGRLLDMTEIMVMCYEAPEIVETVLEKAAKFLIEYAKAFKAVGANGICIAEPAAGLLSPGLIAEFSTPYVNEICKAVQDDEFMVLYHNCGNVEPLLDNLSHVKAAAYSFGNAANLLKTLEALPSDKLIFGNIDPAGIIRNSSPETVREQTLALMSACGGYPNFVIASGCDIPPAAPLENIQAFFDAVEKYYSIKRNRHRRAVHPSS